MPGKRVEEYFDSYGPAPIIEITYDVHLRRRPLYYVIYMILPTSVISFMSLLAFLLPSDSGEKIGLGQCIDRSSPSAYLGLLVIVTYTKTSHTLLEKNLLVYREDCPRGKRRCLYYSLANFRILFILFI